MTRKNKHLFVAGLGLAFIGGAVFFRYDTQKFIENAVPADGTVIEVTSYTKKKPRKTIYEPIVEFETATGERVSFKGPEISEGTYAVGDAVEVLYEVDDPEGARLGTFDGIWGSAIMASFCGVFFVIKGLLSAVFTKS